MPVLSRGVFYDSGFTVGRDTLQLGAETSVWMIVSFEQACILGGLWFIIPGYMGD